MRGSILLKVVETISLVFLASHYVAGFMMFYDNLTLTSYALIYTFQPANIFLLIHRLVFI